MAFRTLRRIQSHSWYQSLVLPLRSSQWLLTELAARVDWHVRGSSMWKPLAPRLSSALPSVAKRMLYSKIHVIVVLVAVFPKPSDKTKDKGCFFSPLFFGRCQSGSAYILRGHSVQATLVGQTTCFPVFTGWETPLLLLGSIKAVVTFKAI